ncbi:hypothetical protein [Dokdonella immobilis]|nr:hypothetical protein [Dokdonella immobilis]
MSGSREILAGGNIDRIDSELAEQRGYFVVLANIPGEIRDR